jgi:hypothetical protein
MMHRRWSSCVLAFALIVVCVFQRANAATPQEVQRAIDRGKEFLYKQHKNGNWDEEANRVLEVRKAYHPKAVEAAQKEGKEPPKPPEPPAPYHNTGWTAVATYALLAAGESPQEPRIADAIQYMLKNKTIGVYGLGLRLNVWNLLPKTPDIQAAIKADSAQLLQGMKEKADAKGFYAYTAVHQGSNYDHSVSQYAVLGVWAAAQADLEIPRSYWLDVDTAWRRHQYEDGSWSYIFDPNGKLGGSNPKTSMTAAGVATLFITQDYLKAMANLNCKGSLYDEDIERGLEWIGRNFKTQTNPYTLYGIERIGVASGYKYLEGIDWYAEGANILVKTQGKDGEWNDSGSDLVGTSFALLFLARGRAPVVMNKLDYSTEGALRAIRAAPAAAAKPSTPATAAGATTKPGKKPAAGDAIAAERQARDALKAVAVKNPWNQRPRDAANVARWIGRQVERDLNFQIITLAAPVEDMHDAPILYISGNKPLEFNAEQKAKLKRYVEDGGLIVGNADCNGAEFAASFRKLGTEMFAGYEFRPLADDHVIYTNQQFQRSKWKRKPTVLGLSNGARELMILFPDSDPAKAWQTQSPGGKEELFQVAANLFLYAVDKQGLRNKGETYLVKKDAKIRPQRTIKVARLIYPGNADPEPGGWRRLENVMHNEDKVGLEVEPVKLGAAALKGGGYDVAHLTGAGPFKLDELARSEIKAFVGGGGTLVVDAAGGSSEFATAVEGELSTIFGNDAKQLLEPLAAAHPVYAAGGKKLEDVAMRDWARANLGGDTRNARLRGITFGGRLGVVYSREDLSTGLVGHPVDGIIGYQPKTATELMEKILLHATANGNVAARGN